MLNNIQGAAHSVGLNKTNIFTIGALLGGVQVFPYFISFIQLISHNMLRLAQASVPVVANWFIPANLLAVIVVSQCIFHKQENEKLEDYASRCIFENDRFWPLTRSMTNSLLGFERYTAFAVGYALPSTLASSLLVTWGSYSVLAASLAAGTIVSALTEKCIFARTDKAVIGNVMEFTQSIMNKTAAFIEKIPADILAGK